MHPGGQGSRLAGDNALKALYLALAQQWLEIAIIGDAADQERAIERLSMSSRRFPPPWSVDETGHCSPAPVARLPRPLDFGFLQFFHGHWLLSCGVPPTGAIQPHLGADRQPSHQAS